MSVFKVKFTISKESIPLTDPDDFIQYLIWNKLFVDVWSGDSFIHVGTCAIPLKVLKFFKNIFIYILFKFLCRQNINSIVSNIQCPIIQEGLSNVSIVTGLLYIRMANNGYSQEKRFRIIFIFFL